MPGESIGEGDQHANVKSGMLVGADCLLMAIDAYRSGLEDFHLNAPEDDDGANAYAAETYCRPMTILEAWEKPATSGISAIAALRLAKDAFDDGDVALVAPMLAAALAYFDAAP